MDDDDVLRALSADLERNDPALAAFLSGQGGPPHHASGWWLLLIPVPFLAGALVLPGTVVLGAVAVVAALASPFVVFFWFLGSDGVPAPHG